VGFSRHPLDRGHTQIDRQGLLPEKKLVAEEMVWVFVAIAGLIIYFVGVVFYF
jgi:hypothetical protein